MRAPETVLQGERHGPWIEEEEEEEEEGEYMARILTMAVERGIPRSKV